MVMALGPCHQEEANLEQIKLFLNYEIRMRVENVKSDQHRSMYFLNDGRNRLNKLLVISEEG